jgi:hypothetical protein
MVDCRFVQSTIGNRPSAIAKALSTIHRLWGFAMGRTVATFRDLIEQELQNWKQRFGRALRQEEQAHLEAMFNRVRLYVQACTYHFPVDAMHGIHVAVELDHEIRLRKIEAALGINLETQWMDSRPLPLRAGNGDVADRVGPETPPAD